MTTERRKAFLMMGITFITGIIIGVLATGFFARQHYHSEKEGSRESYKHGRWSFSEKIFYVVDADSIQQKQMKPIIEETTTKIDRLQNEGMKYVRSVMDSMVQKLNPILKPEQQKDLYEYMTRHDRHRSSDGGNKNKEDKSEKEDRHEKE
ncbi:MAG: hypothetical protein JSS93_07250 [Bacteroidetes bacterium]|nr:hypothetical protein [Bacteroidota bacterium]